MSQLASSNVDELKELKSIDQTVEDGEYRSEMYYIDQLLNNSIDAFTLVIDLKMSFPYEDVGTETLATCQNPAKILELKHPQEKDDLLDSMDTGTLKFNQVLDDENAKWLAWYMTGSGIILFILSCYVMIYAVIALMIHLSNGSSNIPDTKNKRRLKQTDEIVFK